VGLLTPVAVNAILAADAKHQGGVRLTTGQLSLFGSIDKRTKTLAHVEFSHGEVGPQQARQELETTYGALLDETDEFNRQLVSFQANKTETLHSWIKYREGFSATLVERLMNKLGVEPGDVVLDPFAGSCTTLLVAQALGVNAVGIELLPNSHLAWEAKSRAYRYDLRELDGILRLVTGSSPPSATIAFPHLSITESAFPEETERDLMAYAQWFESLDISEDTRLLSRFALMSILESVSYTRKDGQYLRWDGRATKLQEANARRVARGQSPIAGIDKGDIPSVRDELLHALSRIRSDTVTLQREIPAPSYQTLIEGSTLFELPKMRADQFAAIVTSPPYANRYDYTRTYALELAYLGVNQDIFRLRQSLLSCTVENRPKLDELREHYATLGREDDFHRTLQTAQSNAALCEVNEALNIRNRRGEINNTGVLGMINQYFTELAFVFSELFRVCRADAHVAVVNDNVRYAGEIIPVDLLSTDLARAVGFMPVKIWVLPQRKGNSSQQMGKFGRAELRKSITLWKKAS
jgi:site-specific DNA-methyltransferase (cytosine-N4-specific)